ncbi:MAG: DUF4180 domain-containing protein [Bacteroidales bacterium]|nr:DUF4180 domain-containing protein [Bacteroidales bacterium]
MIKYHKFESGITLAEIVPESGIIESPGDLLDIMADAGYNGCSALILHRQNLTGDFFDLKTGIAGEMLQKFSNYRMKLAIIGDFSDVKSKSLGDFIRESNRRGIINFVKTTDEAIELLKK